MEADGRSPLTHGPAEEEAQLVRTVLEILDAEKADSLPIMRLELQLSGDAKQELKRLGLQLEDLFVRNQMNGERGYYRYSRTDNGVPRIDRIYPGEEDQEEVAQPPAPMPQENIPPPLLGPNPNFRPQPNFFQSQIPFVGRPNGRGPPPLFPPVQPLIVPAIFVPPHLRPYHQMGAAPPPPQPQPPRQPLPPQQPPQQQLPQEPRFVRMPKFYEIVNELVHNSQNGVMSMENLFDSIEDVLAEQNLKLNDVQQRDMKGVIKRGITAGELRIQLEEYMLYTEDAYRNFKEQQRLEQQAPVENMRDQFQHMQMNSNQNYQPMYNEYRQSPQPTNGFGQAPQPSNEFHQAPQSSNEYRQPPQPNGMPPMQNGEGFHQEYNRRLPETSGHQNAMGRQSVARSAVFVDSDDEEYSSVFEQQIRPKNESSNMSYCSEVTATTTESSSGSSIFSRPRTFDSYDNNRFGPEEEELDIWSQQIVMEFSDGATSTVFRPRDGNEQAVLSAARVRVVNRWGKKIKKLPEVMLLLKSHWLKHQKVDYKFIADDMFADLGFGGLNWYKLGIVPDDLASMQLIRPVNYGKIMIDDMDKTEEEKASMRLVAAHPDIQVLSIYQMEGASLPGQVYQLIAQFNTEDMYWIPFAEILRNTAPVDDAGRKFSWRDFNNDADRFDFLIREVAPHDEIFEITRREDGTEGVQFKLPLAHLVVL